MFTGSCNPYLIECDFFLNSFQKVVYFSKINVLFCIFSDLIPKSLDIFCKSFIYFLIIFLSKESYSESKRVIESKKTVSIFEIINLICSIFIIFIIFTFWHKKYIFIA